MIADSIADGRLRIVCSVDLLDEQASVLSRDRMARHISPTVAEVVRRLYLQVAEFVEPGEPPRACRDPSDDYLLALASASQADYLVTRDADLLILARYGTTDIVYPARFLQLLEAAPRSPQAD